MPAKSAERLLKVLCQRHRIDFETSAGATILCGVGGEALARDFPHGDFWEYCCDCQRYWLSDLDSGGKGREKCIYCESQIARRYVCDRCKLISFEGDGLVKRKKPYSLAPAGAVEPECPGCLTTPAAEARAHKCDEVGVAFMTARTICPFCEDPVGDVATKASAAARACPNPNCAKPVVAGARFCGACGTVLEAAKPATPQTATPPAAPHTLRAPAPARADKPAAVTNAAAPRVAPPAAAPPVVAPPPVAPVKPDRAAPTPSNGAGKVSGRPTTYRPTPGVEAGASERHTKVNNLIALVALLIVLLAAIVGAVVFLRKQVGVETPPAAEEKTPPAVAEKTPPVPPGVVAPARMAYVEGGEFMMGSAAGDEFERPPHRRTVAPFFIDLYEVTNEEYARFVKEMNHPPPTTWPGGQYPAGAAQQPVAGVTWDDANAYARWARKRLPSEEEWEFAARGREGRRYPWGNEWKAGLANATGNAEEGGAADVGTFKGGVSPFGAFDMIGNVWEWTASEVRPYPGGRLPRTFADDYKIIRGGSWREGREATATYRGYLRARGSKDYSGTGFRCAADVKTAPAGAATKK